MNLEEQFTLIDESLARIEKRQRETAVALHGRFRKALSEIRDNQITMIGLLEQLSAQAFATK